MAVKTKPAAKAPKTERIERLDRVLMFPNTWDHPFLEDLTDVSLLHKAANDGERSFITDMIKTHLEKKYGFREIESRVISDTKSVTDKLNSCAAFFFVDTVTDGELVLTGSALTTTGGKQEIQPEKGLLLLTAGVKTWKLFYTGAPFRTVIVFTYKKPIVKK